MGPFNTAHTVDISVFTDSDSDLNIFLTEGVEYRGVSYEHYSIREFDM